MSKFVYLFLLFWLAIFTTNAQNYLNTASYRTELFSINPALLDRAVKLRGQATHTFGLADPPFRPQGIVNSSVSIQTQLAKLRLAATINRGFDELRVQLHNNELPLRERFLYNYLSRFQLTGITLSGAYPVWTHDNAELTVGVQAGYQSVAATYVQSVLGVGQFIPDFVGITNYMQKYVQEVEEPRTAKQHVNGGLALAFRNKFLTTGIAYVDRLENRYPVIPQSNNQGILTYLGLPKRLTAYAGVDLRLHRAIRVVPSAYYRTRTIRVENSHIANRYLDANADLYVGRWLRVGGGLWNISTRARLNHTLISFTIANSVQVGYSQTARTQDYFGTNALHQLFLSYTRPQPN